ncbi:acyltransferase domain-containing protein, partial [Actinoplanes sp. NPDC049118]|uniref:acyltransferase domain-containing protein n=1 Tax=Actinoplanes sp. NPDC049118 TaxID=3155769 RepID=UPI0033D1904C
SGAVSLLSEAREWPATDRPRRAGVSSFGISGTNAHVIIEEAAAEAVEATRPAEPRPVLLPLSARSEAALRGQAERLISLLSADPEPADVAVSLATQRGRLPHRAAVVGTTAGELIDALRDLQTAPPVRDGRGPVMVFPGQGSQWVGMAVELAAASSVFASALRDCAEALAPHVDWDLFEALKDEGLLSRVDVVQPVSFAVHVSLARLWESFGVVPAAVVGHSQGEIAAACVAGALSLADAARIVAVRSKAIRVLSGTGLMASIGRPLTELPEGVSIAAVNAPSSVVVSGEPQAVRDLVAACEADGVRARLIAVDYASHSAMVESLREELIVGLGEVNAVASAVPMFSTVTGEWADTTSLDAGYWFENLRRTVRFADAIEALSNEGFGLFVEVSAHPVVAVPISEMGGTVVGSLRRDDGGWGRFLASVGEAFSHGADVTLPPGDGRIVDLPTYAFERHRFWLEADDGPGDLTSAGLGATTHPLLPAAVVLPDGDGVVLTGQVSARNPAWLADHQVFGSMLLPGAAFVELAVRAGDEVGCDRVEELTLAAPLVLDERPVVLRVVVGVAADDGRRPVTVHSCAGSDVWTTHAAGTLAAGTAAGATDLRAWPPAGAGPVDLAGFYPGLEADGYGYGPAFRGLRRAWRRGDEIFTEVALPETASADAARYALHPALLDAVLQGSTLLEDDAATKLPFSFTGVTLFGSGAAELRCRITMTGPNSMSVLATDGTGEPVVAVEALDLRAVTADQLAGDARGPAQDAMYRPEWTVAPLAADGFRGSWTEVTGLDDLTGDVPDVVVLPVTGVDTGDLAADVHRTTADVLTLVQRWLADDRFERSRLALVTSGAVVAEPGEHVTDLITAAAWGLVRSAQAENPDRFVLVDLDDAEASRAALPDALGTGEPELAVHGGTVRVRRLRRAGGDALTPPAGDVPWRLDVTASGTLENLALVPAPDLARELAEGEVRVSVRAAGLNFRDVVTALGMVHVNEIMGGEASGVVLEVGPGVTDLAVGDRVVGLFTGAFGPVAVTHRTYLAPMPQGWTFAQAAAVPVTYVTALYGLVDLAGVCAGRRVLVHAGAGGVGMAAVQLARHLGAEV